MELESVRAAVHEVVQAMARTDPGALTGDLRLVDDLGYDSLRLIELAIAVEQRLGLPQVDLEQAITVTTVDDVVALALDLRGAPR